MADVQVRCLPVIPSRELKIPLLVLLAMAQLATSPTVATICSLFVLSFAT
jgi:hypothetical protein